MYSRIFAASASLIQSAFFPCISLMIDIHRSLVSTRAVARSRPWQTLHSCSKRAFTSSTADTAGTGATGFGSSFLAHTESAATISSTTRKDKTARKRMGKILLFQDEMAPILLPPAPFLNRNRGGSLL